MKFDLVSDYHADLWKQGTYLLWGIYRNPGSDVLVLAGDTSNYVDDIPVVIKDALEVYKHVIFVDGNHEHYSLDRVADVDDVCDEFLAFANANNNVTFLKGKNSVRFGRTVFIGCNGWYNFRVWENRWSLEDVMAAWHCMSNDPRMIDFGMTPVGVRAMADAANIRKQVEDLQDEDVDIVVVTHTIPTKVMAQWSPYANTPDAILDGAYYNTDMEDAYFMDLNKRIKVWTFGHTHHRLDKTVGHVRYVNNARGYESETGKLSRWFIAQIDTEDKGYV